MPTTTPGKRLSVFFRVSPVGDNDPEPVRATLTDSGVTAEAVAQEAMGRAGA